MKRILKNADIPEISKKSKSQCDQVQLDDFVSWCNQNFMIVNEKVKPCWGGACAQYGMVTTQPVSSGECLFEIPRSLLLTQHTCSIAQLLKQESDALVSESGWIPQLLALMYECVNTSSKWKPYLTLFPDYKELDLPMFWNRDEVDKELQGTGVPESMVRDLKSMEKEFTDVVLPFVQKHGDIFTDPRCRDFEFYKKIVAFVMAYSFTEPVTEDGSDDDEDQDDKSPPMMVPMADILNHVAANNAHLDFGKDSLKMVAVQDIAEGEEVYNTYGELPNFQLLHMYGFAEAYPCNFYDTVELPMTNVYNYLCGCDIVQNTIKDRWSVLVKNHIITEGGAFVIGEEGVLTEEEMLEMLKVVTMDEETFDVYRKSDDWMEDDDTDISLLKDDIKQLPENWRIIIKHIATCVLEEYGGKTSEEEEENLQSDKWRHLSRRQQYCVYVRYGQMKLLHNLKNCCIIEDKNTKTIS